MHITTIHAKSILMPVTLYLRDSFTWNSCCSQSLTTEVHVNMWVDFAKIDKTTYNDLAIRSVHKLHIVEASGTSQQREKA